jgi:hypothetical protein
MGIILDSQKHFTDLVANKLMVKIGSMSSITLFIHSSNFPILFMITDIPVSQIINSTLVTVLVSNPKTIIAYEAKERVVFTSDFYCDTVLFRVSEESKKI